MPRRNPRLSNRTIRAISHSYHKKHPIRNTIISLAIIVLFCLIIGGGLFFHYIAGAPMITRKAMSSDSSTQVYDANNHMIARLGSQDREYVPYRQLPKQLKDGLISTEDRHFYHSDGIDLGRIFEAAINDLKGNNIQGGSTITQQLVKLSVFSTNSSSRTLKRKAQEAWLAMKVDKDFPKNKILEYYVNKVYMGYNCYGIKTASEYYYGKPLNKLTLPEMALLAGMPQSPVQYDPYRFPKMAKLRRQQVLVSMVKNHKLSKSQAHQANVAPIQADLTHRHRNRVNVIPNEKVIDPYLKQVLIELKNKGYRLNSGLKVYTNLNMRNQQYMYNLANNRQNKPGFPDRQMQIGGALIQPRSGKINALIGGRQQNAVLGLDRSNQVTRSTGSVAKPITAYSQAIQDCRLGTNSIVYDTPFNYSNGTPLYDFDHRYEGSITADKALTDSRNIPAVKLLKQVGVQRSARMIRRVGIDPGKHYSLQSAINLYASPIQTAAAYAPFANGTGNYYQPTTINRVINNLGQQKRFKSKPRHVISRGASFIMATMLKHAVDDSIGIGSPNRAKVNGLDEGGKTGTVAYPEHSIYKGKLPNYSSMDTWFTGITPEYVCSIWDGYDNPNQHNHYVSLKEVDIPMRYYKALMPFVESQRGVKHSTWRKPNTVMYSRNNGFQLKR